ITAVGEAAEVNPEQRQRAARVSSPLFARPHRLAAPVRAHQHVEEAVAILEEGELVERAAGDLERARRAAVERDAEHRGLDVPHEHGGGGDVENASGGAKYRGALAIEIA